MWSGCLAFLIKAENSLGTTYSSDGTFTTLGQVPTVIVHEATPYGVGSKSYKLNGTVNANYLTTTVTFEYGTTISYGNTVAATEGSVTGGTNTDIYSTVLGLEVGTTYHYRIKAENSLGTSISDDMTFLYLYYGATYQGGLVFYIDGTGQHGLVCASTDQSSSAEWGCFGVQISGTEGTAIGTGNQNTINIVNGCSTAGIAAKICYDLELNGYNDWFLPSKDELSLMMGIGSIVSGFEFKWYWSSSDYGGYPYYSAWCAYYSIGLNHFYKSDTYYVRAVRSF
jgi:hypothetical protein